MLSQVSEDGLALQICLDSLPALDTGPRVQCGRRGTNPRGGIVAQRGPLATILMLAVAAALLASMLMTSPLARRLNGCCTHRCSTLSDCDILWLIVVG